MTETILTSIITTMKPSLLIQNYGNGIAIGISGLPDDVEYLGNQLYNWGITESNPMEMTLNFAYVLSSMEKLGSYLKENGQHINLKNLDEEGYGIALFPYKTKNILIKIRAEKFLPERNDFEGSGYGFGEIDNSLPS